MPQIIGGKFNGTGAALVLCLGGIPDELMLWNVEAATPNSLEWSKFMSDVLCNEGIFRDAAGGATQDMANGQGVAPYYGGVTLTSTLAGTTTYGEGNYLKPDPTGDYRYYSGNKSPGDAVAEDITTWTYDSGYTGHFNEDVTGTYIGEGSRICIDSPGWGPRWYTIVALTAGQGEAAAEVTLSATGVKSGKVRCIKGMYDYIPMIAGEMTGEGVTISNATLNANGNIIAFRAIWYD